MRSDASGLLGPDSNTQPIRRKTCNPAESLGIHRTGGRHHGIRKDHGRPLPKRQFVIKRNVTQFAPKFISIRQLGAFGPPSESGRRLLLVAPQIPLNSLFYNIRNDRHF
jgi:hypothetical protein